MANLFDGLPAEEPSARTGFARNRIDRRSEKRGEDAVGTARAAARPRLYLFHGDKVMLRGTDPLFTVGEAANLGLQRAETILLGWTHGGPRLSGVIPEAVSLPGGTVAETDLRSVATEAAVSPESIGALAQARSLLNWHQRHRFCSVCGQPSVMKIGGYRRDCPSCGAEHFPRTDPVVIMLTIDGDRCLLGRQQRFVTNMYSCLAGFLEPGETVEDAVRRETFEESGIKVGRVRYHASQPWPFPSSLMIGCHAEAKSTEITRDEAELEDCRWFPRTEVRAMLAGTHPNGLKAPQPVAIAHHLIRFWAEAG
jgi:NAD+ diphosphatase